MLRRAVLAAVVALFLLPGLAAAQKPITLWHVFSGIDKRPMPADHR